MNDISELYNIKNVHIDFQPQNLFERLINENKIHYKEKVFSKGSFIVKEKTQHNYIYFIKDGIVSVEKQEDIYTFFPKGNFIGLNVLSRERSPFFSFVAFTDVEVIRFDRAEVETYLNRMQERWLFLYVQEQRFRDHIYECYLFRREKGIEKVELAITFINKIFPNPTQRVLPPEIPYKEFARFVGIKESTIQKILKKRNV
ncbi:Crp/Fnr family transcriptional regulator [Listeria costaricensis]|uniref:Crp/Fnr family transcriptional regulator n=1 Tax=Listeria costaricensis TaxID=2026604 RepID=UPI000C06BFB1|nr:Crp/Fnr family transcriptional regulator [Listeria costaricensis]